MITGAGSAHRAVDVLIVGAGQAGLGTGYWLSRRTSGSFLIVDAAPRPGQSWCDRWDSLTLFTPRRFSALPGLRFPKGEGRYPTKAEMQGYLAEYARRFELPVQLDTRTEVVEPAGGGGFLARTNRGTIGARHVVVATGPFSRPAFPVAADDLDAGVHQLHSSEYNRPADIPPGDVLVVGGGNSAAQLAVELAASHRVTVAAPKPLWYLPDEILGISLYWWIYATGVLNAGADSSVGRYVRQRGDAIIGRQLDQLVTDGTVRLLLSRVAAGHGRTVTLADGTRLTPSTVLWCTGFRPSYPWLRVPGALDADGAPRHDAGASPVPGLQWIGLPWQTRLNSSIADGVDRDAQALVGRLLSVPRTTRGSCEPASRPTEGTLSSRRCEPTPGGVGSRP